MKRILALLVCAALLLASCAFAQEAGEAAPLEGVVCYPQGATEETARYRFAYRYPQLTGTDAASQAVNAYYQGILREQLATTLPQAYEALALEGIPDGPGYSTTVEYAIRCWNEDFLSVVLTETRFEGNYAAPRLSAEVFALQGDYAGTACGLSQVVGLEQAEGELGDGPSYASQLAYKLVWQVISEQQALGLVDYLEGLAYEDVARAFDPETDFYLDEDGNLVFFLQSGMVAGEVEGVLTFPFSVAELLSAVNE